MTYQPGVKHKGALLVLILIFGAVFFTIATGIIGYVVTQSRLQAELVTKDQAQNIAEAGLDYYKWYLAHNPNDYTDGTGHAGPYIIPYTDPQSGSIGAFELRIATSSLCGTVTSVTITSTGYTNANPNIKRTITVKYARPTVAQYSYIINSNVWAGADRTIIGPYYSNGVIRMDGKNNSTVTSGQASWRCDGSMPCSPGSYGSTVNGVYGDGPDKGLWKFPAPPINFTGLTVDLATMKDKAQHSGGVYLPPSGRGGYHIVFQPDGTFNVYQVQQTDHESNGYAWGRTLNIIKNAKYLGNYSISASCPVIFAEDQVWLDGVVNGKVSIAAASLSGGTGNSGYQAGENGGGGSASQGPSIILDGNITYANASSGLLAIGQNNVLVGFQVPDNMTLNGIFVAQNGHFGRDYYSTAVPHSWWDYIKRNSLTINGTIVSNGSVGTKWICGNTYCSGFKTRYNSYDRTLVDSPPALTPKTSDTYQFTDWREQN